MKKLRANEISFERTAGGMLRAEINGTTREPVDCIPLFPLSRPEHYVTVLHRTDDTPEELGVIESLAALPKEQQELVTAAIALRHFTPVIIDIADIRSRHGTARWDVTTDRGPRQFRVRDMKENVELRDTGLLLITDTEGCRYQIPDYRTLPSHGRQLVEKFLL